MTIPEIDQIRERLQSLRASVADRIREYPTPIAGCDQQFNYLLELRGRIGRELQCLDDGSLSEKRKAELVAFLDSAE